MSVLGDLDGILHYGNHSLPHLNLQTLFQIPNKNTFSD